MAWAVCNCCGRNVWHEAMRPAAPRCSMCETRDGVCQHNTFTRAQAGDHRVATSRPLHREATR